MELIGSNVGVVGPMIRSYQTGVAERLTECRRGWIERSPEGTSGMNFLGSQVRRVISARVSQGDNFGRILLRRNKIRQLPARFGCAFRQVEDKKNFGSYQLKRIIGRN